MTSIIFWYFLILFLCCIYLAKKAYQQSENLPQRFEDLNERCYELTTEKADIQAKMIKMAETHRAEIERLEDEIEMYLSTGNLERSEK